jgi:hypothetical protein
MNGKRKRSLRNKSNKRSRGHESATVAHCKIEIEGEENPYLHQVKALRRTLPHWDNLFDVTANDVRLEEWIRLEGTVAAMHPLLLPSRH